MSRIEGNYAGLYYSNPVQQETTKETNEINSTQSTEKKKQTGLSKVAQDFLEKLRKANSGVDIMVADFDNAEEAREALSRGTKEFSILFSSEKLEKMATDEKYANEQMGRVQTAMRMSEEINKQFGFESAFGTKSENGEVARIGISFNKDGSTTYFAELEKASVQQRERIERTREERAEEKKEAAKKEKYQHADAKKTTVWANSEDELIDKIKEIDWGDVRKEGKTEGSRIDYSV